MERTDSNNQQNQNTADGKDIRFLIATDVRDGGFASHAYQFPKTKIVTAVPGEGQKENYFEKGGGQALGRKERKESHCGTRSMANETDPQ